MRPGDGVGGGIGDRLRRVAGVGLQHDRVAEERRVAGHVGELAAELAVGQVQRAIAHERQRRGVPEGGRAAVAERDLVAVGGAEELADAGAHAARRARGRASGGARFPCSARARRRGGRGPRAGPSRGRTRSGRRTASGRRGSSAAYSSSCGQTSHGSRVQVRPRRAAMLLRRSPVVCSTRTPVATARPSLVHHSRSSRRGRLRVRRAPDAATGASCRRRNCRFRCRSTRASSTCRRCRCRRCSRSRSSPARRRPGSMTPSTCACRAPGRSPRSAGPVRQPRCVPLVVTV